MLRYSFGSYYETLSSKIMKVTSFFVSDIGEIANKMLLAVSKDVEKIGEVSEKSLRKIFICGAGKLVL